MITSSARDEGLITVSTIIPTIGRPSLARAINSVLNQDFSAGDFEVIVVNDSGQPLSHESWLDASRVTIINTNRRERSVARNTGAAVARGRYLHFLDDDDWLTPGAFKALWSVASRSPAAWVYGGFQLVDNDANTVLVIRPPERGNCYMHLIASEWLPLQASWISERVFHDVGGFAHLHTLAGGYEDIDLARQISYQYDFARTDDIVANIRVGDAGSTTNYRDLIRQNRCSREKSLNMPDSFARMKASAGVDRVRSAYWQGRIVYYCLASALWQFKRGEPLRAASRLGRTISSFFSGGRYWLCFDFWRGAFRPHHNLVRTLMSHEKIDLYPNTTWKK